MVTIILNENTGLIARSFVFFLGEILFGVLIQSLTFSYQRPDIRKNFGYLRVYFLVGTEDRPGLAYVSVPNIVLGSEI